MRRKILKTYPHLEELDNYALKVMKLIMRFYPAWAPLARIGEFKLNKYVTIEVPAPVKLGERDLIITTYSNDLTVYFDWYHAHFGRWYDTPEEAFEQAKIFIDRILREDFIIGIKMANGKWAGSRGYTPDTLHEATPDLVTYTRSWRGTYNQLFEHSATK